MYACVCVCVCLCECVCMRARTDKKRKIKCTSHSYVALSSYSSMTSFGPFHLDDLSLHLSLSSVPFFFYHYATSSILFPLPSSYTHLPTSSSPPSSFLTLHPPPHLIIPTSLPPLYTCRCQQSQVKHLFLISSLTSKHYKRLAKPKMPPKQRR